MPIDLSPEDISREFGRNPFRADAPAVGDSGRFGAAVDRMQGSLYGLGEAVGLPTRGLRLDNQTEADRTMQRFYRENPEAPQSYKDVDGVGSAWQYAKGLAIDSAPQMAGMLAAGFVNPAAGLAVGATLGTADVLDNQREQAGKTNLLTALPLGVAYGAVDALTGTGAALAKRSLRTTGIKAVDDLGAKSLDDIAGYKGVLARGGVAVAKSGLTEGVGETLQEGMNQLGRMSVDGRAELFSPEALDRYAESFVGGGVLGGLMGGSTGWMRQRTPATNTPGADTTTDPMPPLQQGGLNLNTQQTPIGDVSAQTDLAPMTTSTAVSGVMQEQQVNLEQQQEQAAIDADPAVTEMRQKHQELAAQADQIAKQNAAVQQVGAETYGLKGNKALELFTQLFGMHQQGEVTDAQLAENVGMLKGNMFGQVNRFMTGVQKTKEAALKGEADSKAADTAAVQKGKSASVPKTPETLEAKTQGSTAAPILATAPSAVPAAPVVNGDAPVQTTGLNQPVVAGAMVAQPVQKDVENGIISAPAQIAGIDSTKQVTVGRKGREQTLTPQQLQDKLTGATPKDKRMVMMALGWDVEEDVDTGRPVIVESGQPMKFAAIGEAMGMSRQGVAQALQKFGIDEETSTKTTSLGSANTVTDEELGIDPAANGSGFRVETEASKATGQGLVDDGNYQTKAQREASAQADELLKAAGASTALAVSDDTAPVAQPGQTVTDLRDQNPSIIERNTRELLQDAEAGNAAADWDSEVVSWGDLPDGLKANVIADYKQNLSDNEGELDFQRLARTQGETENDYTTFKSARGNQEQGLQSLTGGNPASPGRPESGQALIAGDASPDRRGASSLGGDAGTQAQGAATKFSVTQDDGVSTTESVRSEVEGLMPINPNKLTIVEKLEDLPPHVQADIKSEAPSGKKVQAFVNGGRAYLIAGNIPKGKGRAIFLHEVGSHLGLDNLLSEDQRGMLVAKIMEWADKNDGSVESKIARKAIERVGNASTADEQLGSELMAYFIEEAVNSGVNPTALNYKSELGRWFQSLMAAFSRALRKLGIANIDELTPKDVVDLAYGAAHMEMTGGKGRTKFSVAPAAKMPPAVQNGVSEVTGFIERAAKKALTTVALTSDLVSMAVKRGLPSAQKYYDMSKAVDGTRQQMVQNIDEILSNYQALPAHERGTGAGSVNAFLKASTTSRKWGFLPEFSKTNGSKVNVDSELAARFDALSKPAQKIVRDVFEHGRKSLAEMKSAIRQNADTEFNALIAAAEKIGDEKAAALARAERDKALAEFKDLLSTDENWPYAPLQRFGNHVVVAVSKKYQDLLNKDDPTDQDKKALRDLRLEAEHYHVEFAETEGEAVALAKKLQGSYGYVKNFEKDGVDGNLFGGTQMLGAFRRLRNLVENSADKTLSSQANAAMDKLMRDMHLSLLRETSIRQSQRKRDNISGADADMMRAFATQGKATAHFIGTMKNGAEIEQALSAMKKEADRYEGDANERRKFYNELLRRHAMGLTYEPTPRLDKVMAATSAWQLLTNPAYYLQNMTQTYVMSLPIIASRHGYAKSFNAITSAYKELFPLIRDGVSAKMIAKLPQDVKAAVQSMVDGGLIDISLENDLGNWSSEEGQSQALSKALGKLRSVSEKIEFVNRMATAMAASRLEAGANSSPEQVKAFAAKVLRDTHGDYSGFNAPRFMRTNTGRLLTQFRKFQIIQASMYAKLLHQAFKGASPEERKAAKLALSYSLAHMGALGGIVGMPGYTLISSLLGAVFGDDGDDPEQYLRDLVGGGAVADLLLRGVPNLAGVDLSGKLGASNMLSVFPYADGGLSRKGAESYILAAAGPFIGGLLPRFAEGVNQITQGNYYQGLEQLLPGGLSTGLKAVRFADQGVTNKAGDVLISPDEIAFSSLVGQALGLPTTQLTDRQREANVVYESDKAFRELSKQIKQDYTKAYRSSDSDGMAAAREAWTEMQDNKRAKGYKTDTVSELLKAPLDQAKRERETLGGMQYRKDNKGLVERLAAD